MSTGPVGRLAPTPSGYLHVGNARSFLAAWLAARAAQGRVILRIEDIDRERCTVELEAAQIDDLRWLGLDWDDGPVRQSERLPLYQQALEQLRLGNHAYPCTCSRREIAAYQVKEAAAGSPDPDAGAPHVGEEPLYRDTCRGRFASAKAANDATNRQALWRLQTPSSPMTFTDALHGPQSFDPHALSGDFVVMRRDAWPSYQLAVTVDDAAMGVTQVVRGLDLLPSTARQLLLYKLLDLTPPSYWLHLPLVTDASGNRLAKRAGGLALRQLRANGVAPETVIGLLCHTLGLAKSPGKLSAHEAIGLWQESALPRAPVVISESSFAAIS